MDIEFPEPFELTPEVIKGLGFSQRALAEQIINPKTRQHIGVVEVAKWYRGARRPRSWGRRGLLAVMQRLKDGENIPKRARRKKTRRQRPLDPERIQAILDAFDVSHHELAEQTHTNRSTWTRWCSGERRPDPHNEMLLKILEWLAGLKDRPPYPFLDARKQKPRG